MKVKDIVIHKLWKNRFLIIDDNGDKFKVRDFTMKEFEVYKWEVEKSENENDKIKF